ncbi:hypothetical protein BDD43_4824 [Mucilaginibacter gracilis]|uniref:MFS transporter n=1 Tax=Mucilaginibacter gracilis TaxID=423350 RepID=A0A495J947_9SPHI|nr:DUF5690 family protein [Mucilaginibacter gracilis]RKR84579.1 hypothetical protein BDD43_4824 [Mucilaginibacter gracilis]
MGLIITLREKALRLSARLTSLLIGISAFGAYTSMYAFRKAFSAGTYAGLQYAHIDYKVWLVIAQVIGYTFSKFYGIRFIAEVKPAKRAIYIITLIGIAWLALLCFALTPAPYNIVFMLVNGFPLGMIWGLVFSYVEGRRSTEFMAAIMSVSLIFASGFVKTVGRLLLTAYHISEYWMPFVTGLLFVLPLLLFVLCLEIAPPPTVKDIKLRTLRSVMNAADRQRFVINFLPGIILTLIIYVLLTVMRDVRDNFEVEIWAGLGVKSNTIYTNIDTTIALIVLFLMSLLIIVRNNLKAFALIHGLIITGCILVGLATLAFNLHLIGPVVWMTCAGLGLYMGYIPYNAIFFERMIASFQVKGNVGFIMYIADSAGYLGSVSVLLIKELGRPGISWSAFFNEGVMVVSLIGAISATCSLLYFAGKAKVKHTKPIAISYE